MLNDRIMRQEKDLCQLNIEFLPDDVIKNSGSLIPLHGNLVGSKDEIIVITQYCRRVYKAYLCHLSKKVDECTKKIYDCIVDMPGFKEIIIDQKCQLKDMFFTEEECCVQYHPPKSEYVNNIPYCLHIWKPIEKYSGILPIPPSLFVGAKGVELK